MWDFLICKYVENKKKMIIVFSFRFDFFYVMWVLNLIRDFWLYFWYVCYFFILGLFCYVMFIIVVGYGCYSWVGRFFFLEVCEEFLIFCELFFREEIITLILV